MKQFDFSKRESLPNIGLVGLGHMGYSLALAIKEKGLAKKLVGFSSKSGFPACDLIFDNFEDFCRELDFIIFATPVSVSIDLMKRGQNFFKEGTIITDIGSTKQSITEFAKGLKHNKFHFIPSHPMAGTEKKGAEFAKVSLYEGKNVFIAKTPFTKEEQFVESFWKSLSCKTFKIDAKRHDQLLAGTSHSLHILSSIIVESNFSKNFDLEELKAASGGGFRDMTRIAMSDPLMWLEIFQDNKKNIVDDLEKYLKEIKKVKSLFEEESFEQLLQYLKKSKEIRDKS